MTEEKQCPKCGRLLYVPIWLTVLDTLSGSEHDVYFCHNCGWKKVRP